MGIVSRPSLPPGRGGGGERVSQSSLLLTRDKQPSARYHGLTVNVQAVRHPLPGKRTGREKYEAGSMPDLFQGQIFGKEREWIHLTPCLVICIGGGAMGLGGKKVGIDS